MNRLLSILLLCCIYSHLYAQTPYDSFSPATLRPILDVVQKMVANKDSLQSSPMDAPLATQDDISKWLSPDPLCDKYPEVSPYAYCGWNPVKYIDPDGKEVTITGEDGITVTYIPGSKYEGNDNFTIRMWSQLDEIYSIESGGIVLNELVNDKGKAFNVTNQIATGPNGLGGAYVNEYFYDEQYRLVESIGTRDFQYNVIATYSPSGRLGNKYTTLSSPSLPNMSDVYFGYDDQHLTHQPRTLYDIISGRMNLYWDANGNIAEMIHCEQDARRFHEWDEDNRLRFVLGERFAGYYGYDANGERVYKLTGTCGIDQINHNGTRAYVMFDDAVLYPNPYLVVTPRGYTKHYYAGTERLATAIGSGGFDDMGLTIGHYDSREEDIAQMFYANYQNEDPFYYDHILSEMIGTSTIEGDNMPELEYRREPIILGRVDVIGGEDLLYSSIEDNLPVRDRERELFFSHSDHLGSANWITDYDGIPIQYLHYAPYGELVENQRVTDYDERYKFTGKERDWETGYDFFGARYLWSDAGIWTSVDPLAGDYPWISPYAYGLNNPLKYKDPNGKWVETAWDIANVGIGAASLVSNLSNGNVADALLDGAGLMLDITAAVLPIVPGGASSAIKAYRTANKVSDAGKATNKFRQAVARGIQSEKRVLKEMGLSKNTSKIASKTNSGKSINVIPDAIEDGVMYEIKDTKAVYNTKQIQGEYNAAKEAGYEFKIVTGEKTHVSKEVQSRAEIIRRSDLGPQ